MDYDESLSLFENLGFEIAQIDDQDVLFVDLSDVEDEGNYAVVTDMDGNMPSNLIDPIMWSVYDVNDMFQWSVTVEKPRYLKELFEESDTLEDVLMSLRNLREDNILASEEY